MPGPSVGLGNSVFFWSQRPSGAMSNGERPQRRRSCAGGQTDESPRTRTPNKIGRPNGDARALVQIQQPHQLCRSSIGPLSGAWNEGPLSQAHNSREPATGSQSRSPSLISSPARRRPLVGRHPSSSSPMGGAGQGCADGPAERFRRALANEARQGRALLGPVPHGRWRLVPFLGERAFV